MVDQLETWKNPTAGRVWVNRLDHRGDVGKVDLVAAGRTFHISTAERRLNQEMAFNTDLDVFQNGTLTPVRLIEGSDDAREFAANPNLLSEPDMRTMVRKSSAKDKEAFLARLTEIRNPATLDRLLALAREEDAPLSRVEAIQDRLAEVTVSAQQREEPPGEVGPRGKRSSAARAVTPH